MLKHFRAAGWLAVLLLAGAGLWAQSVNSKQIEVKTGTLAMLPAIEALRAKTGSGPDDIAGGGNGPAGFAISKRGEFYVLDPENQRIQVFKDNKRIKTIPLALLRFYPVDIALLPDGRIALLDKLLAKSISIFNDGGQKLSDLKLAIKGGSLSNPTRVRCLLLVNGGHDFDGLWVQEGRSSFRIALLSGEPDPKRYTLMDRLAQKYDACYGVETLGEVTAVVLTSDYRHRIGQANEYEIAFDVPIQNMLGLEEDADGNLYLLTMHWEESQPGKSVNERNIVTVLSRSGEILKQFLVYFPHASAIAFRSLRVSPEGKVYYMTLDEKGFCIRMYDPWK